MSISRQTLVKVAAYAGLLGVVCASFGLPAVMGPSVSLVGLATLAGAVGPQEGPAALRGVASRALAIAMGVWLTLAGLNLVPVGGTYEPKNGEWNWSYVRQ